MFDLLDVNNLRFGEGLLTYAETCSRIKEQGILPDEHPSIAMISRVQEIYNRCMTHYISEPGDYTLKGVYIYRSSGQISDLKNTFGYTQDVGNHEALIGLSNELLEHSGMKVFHDIVFIHELAHLTAWEHNERFQYRFNDLEFDYCFYNRVRTDARDHRKINRHGWKM